MNLFYQPLILQGIDFLDPEESRHCIKVLRKTKGDVIRITDGKGNYYDAHIVAPDARQCIFQITKTFPQNKKPFTIHIAIAPTKNSDRFEWFIEKAVEIGVDRITPLRCQHSERTSIKIERIEKVAISAIKQSVKSRMPHISDIVNFDKLILEDGRAQKFIAFVDHTNPDHLKNVARPMGEYLVVIGPEGDFSTDELNAAIAHGFRKVSLGDSRLRTETAGIVACHTLSLLHA